MVPSRIFKSPLTSLSTRDDPSDAWESSGPDVPSMAIREPGSLDK